jgi:hypothetical protein
MMIEMHWTIQNFLHNVVVILEGELDSLEKYQLNHPDEDHDPTSLELFCDENPDASECRIYED